MYYFNSISKGPVVVFKYFGEVIPYLLISVVSSWENECGEFLWKYRTLFIVGVGSVGLHGHRDHRGDGHVADTHIHQPALTQHTPPLILHTDSLSVAAMIVGGLEERAEWCVISTSHWWRPAFSWDTLVTPPSTHSSSRCDNIELSDCNILLELLSVQFSCFEMFLYNVHWDEIGLRFLWFEDDFSLNFLLL